MFTYMIKTLAQFIQTDCTWIILVLQYISSYNINLSSWIWMYVYVSVWQEELKADHASYLRQHPEIRALISDFLQFLLLRKPDDVFQFAREYFLPFASQHPPEPSLKAPSLWITKGTSPNSQIQSFMKCSSLFELPWSLEIAFVFSSEW